MSLGCPLNRWMRTCPLIGRRAVAALVLFSVAVVGSVAQDEVPARPTAVPT